MAATGPQLNKYGWFKSENAARKEREMKTSKKINELAKLAKDDPSALSALERLGKGIKLDSEGALSFVEAIAGPVKVADGQEFVVRPDGKPQPIDPETIPESIGGLVGMVLGLPLGPAGAAAGGAIGSEAVSAVTGKGGASEFLGDVADVQGEIIEQTPEILLSILEAPAAVGKGILSQLGKKLASTAPKRLGSEMAGAFSGRFLRKGISALLPGKDDETLVETTTQSLVNAGLTPIGQGTTSLGVAFKDAPVTVAGHLSKLDLDKPVVKQGLRGAEKLGTNPLPGTLGAQKGAIGMAEVLRNSAGSEDIMAARDVGELIKSSKGFTRAIDGALGSKAPVEDVAKFVAGSLKKVNDDMFTAANKTFGDGFGEVQLITEGKPIFNWDALKDRFAELDQQGVDISGFTRKMKKQMGITPDTIPDKLSATQYQKMLKMISDAKRGKEILLPSQRDQEGRAIEMLRGAAFQTFDDNIGKKATSPAQQVAAQKVRNLRGVYADDMQMIDSYHTALVDNILKREKGQTADKIPKEILADKYGERQLELLGEVLEKASPGEHVKLTRSIIDEIIKPLQEISPAGLSPVRTTALAEAREAGFDLILPGNAAQQLKKHRKKLLLITPKKGRKALFDELEDVIIGLERTELDTGDLGSRTAPMLMRNEALKSLLGAPQKFISEGMILIQKERLANMLSTTEGRNIIAGMAKKPTATNIRILSKAVQKYMALRGRDEFFSDEPKESTLEEVDSFVNPPVGGSK